MLKNEITSADNNNNTDEWITDLIELVEKEISTFQSFLDSLTQLQQSVINGNLNGIEDGSERAGELLSTAKAISSKRQEKVMNLASANQLQTELVTLEQVIPYVETKYRERLRALRTTLLTTLNKVKSSSKATRRLLAHSLNYVEENLNLMVLRNPNIDSYSRKDVLKNTSQLSKFLQAS